LQILHGIGSLDPKTGGPPAVVMGLAAAQADLGHEVTVICGDGAAARSRIDAALERYRGHEGIEVRYDGSEGGLPGAVDAADFLHLHGVWEKLLLRAAGRMRQRDKPYAVTPHGMLDPWALSQKRLKKRIALAVAFRGMLNRASFVHVLNTDERDAVGLLRLKSPSQVIPNGIFLEDVEPLPPAGAFYAKHPELGGRPFIVFLSRLHYKKGLDILAEAFAKLPESLSGVQLVVVGPDEGQQASFECRVAELGVSDRVHLTGPIYGREKFEAIVDAACFCLPSRQEGFSIAITEALACGCPVVISEGCHFPEVAEVGAGRVTPLEPSAVAQALTEVVSDPAIGQAMGQRGRELVCERYTWPKVAEAMMEAYAAATPRV